MGWIEDSVEEFRKLPPAGKIAVGGAAVGVAILAYAQYRANAGGSAPSTTSPNAANSNLSGLGVPSLASSPADWANWFSNGLTIPATPTQTSDGAPASVTSGVTTPGTSSNPIATFTAPAGAAAAVATSAATASAHVATSASAPAPKPAPLPNIQNPTVAQTLAHIAGPIPSAPIQNPTVAQTAAHVGRLAPTNPTFIPTTIRPLPTPGRGRVA